VRSSSSSSGDNGTNSAYTNTTTLIATFTSRVREWIAEPSTVFRDLKAFTTDFNVDLHGKQAPKCSS
jgi:hypothetical protein